MPRTTNKVSGNLAREYAAKYPSAGTRTLARMLLRDAPQVYTSYEHARTMLRSARGENGKRERKRKIVATTKATTFSMPASDAKAVQPLQLNITGKGLIASDWHIPYHDQAACEISVNNAIRKGYTEWLIINGDFLDCYQLSRWEKDPRKRGFAGELEMARDTLTLLKGVFKRIIYKLGNHEVRYESYLRQKAAELLGVPDFELKSLLKAKEIGFDVVEANRVMQVHNLNILHGHEYPFSISNPVNPARGLFLRAKASAICGHFHQSSHHSESDIRGSATSCWSLGALCELHPEYAPLNRWNHGAALAEFGRDDWQIDNFRIINGKVV